MDIRFELYKTFYYVAKELSFSKAAEALFISQSAVSQAIKALEEALDCKLFNRHTKRVKLTKEGKVLFNHVEQALNFLKRGEDSISSMKDLTQGELWIGASDTICKYYLIPHLEKFHKLYPGIKIKITSRTSPVCMDLLIKGNIDLAVVNIPEGFVDKNLKIHGVKNIQDKFIVGKKYRALAQRELTLRELSQYPILMLEKNSTTRKFFNDYLLNNDVKLEPEIELSSIELMVELTKIGLGVSFAVEEVVREDLINEELYEIKVKEAIPSRSMAILTNVTIPDSHAATKFIEVIEAN
ncbi:LysR family transcriptional regulator [Alkaliphilus serpentinus]|uniref:LysR family transcriptional regulator n=1 Tax=Alkaliphilus serpentinus TaxID=1482731 RepID=A0A833HNX8_9FIRM|nr:LysR family transcriptional regulator [Alkaliphilus serpentinus]KAB3530062.1 LysR family transcriptional regulator [Alkaliphilus serpentinus]